MYEKLKNRYRNIPIHVKASFWFLICAFLQKGISSITTPIFTRIMTTEEYGQFSVFNSWMSILTVFVSLNLYSGVYSQGLIKFNNERKEFASSLQGLSLTLAIMWTVIYLAFQSFFNKLFSLNTLQMFSMILLIWLAAVFQFWAVEKRVELNYRILVIITLLVSVIRPGLGIVLVLNSKNKVAARIIGMVLVDFVAYIGLFIFQLSRGKKFFSKKFWKYALSFNLPLVPHYLSSSVLSGSDRIMISRLIGDNEAGIYNLAYSISLIMTMFNTALFQTIEPWLYQKIKDKQIKSMSKVAYSTLFLIAGVNILLIAFAPEIVRIFAPAEYYEAVWIIPPVAMSVYFMFIYSYFAVFEFYYEKTKFIMIATAGSAALNILLNFIFIRLCGYIAAGYTTLFCYILYAIFHFLFMSRICKKDLNGIKPYSIKILFLISAVFLLTGIVFLFSYNNFYMRYALILIILILVIIKRKLIISFVKDILGKRKGTN